MEPSQKQEVQLQRSSFLNPQLKEELFVIGGWDKCKRQRRDIRMLEVIKNLKKKRRDVNLKIDIQKKVFKE